MRRALSSAACVRSADIGAQACLGTNSVLSRDALKHLKDDPVALAAIFTEPEEVPEKYNPDEYGRE